MQTNRCMELIIRGLPLCSTNNLWTVYGQFMDDNADTYEHRRRAAEPNLYLAQLLPLACQAVLSAARHRSAFSRDVVRERVDRYYGCK
jgi:hypothetical protein